MLKKSQINEYCCCCCCCCLFCRWLLWLSLGGFEALMLRRFVFNNVVVVVVVVKECNLMHPDETHVMTTPWLV
jgi:hypothetical protein